MKRFFHLLKPHTIRPMVYSCFSKAVTGVCAILLCKWFIKSSNTASFRSPEDYCFVLAMWFLAWAWFQALALDGIRTKLLTGLDHLTEKHRRRNACHMVDFVNEKVIAFDDLAQEEQIAVKLSSNLISALIFLIPTLISLLC